MRILVAALLSAVVLFFCGFLWWGILMPIVQPARQIDDQPLVDQMSNSLGDSDVYFYPDYTEQDKDNKGPFAILFFRTDPPSMPTMMGMGFIHMLVSALMVAGFVSLLKLKSVLMRFAFVIFAALFVSVWADVGNAIWWFHPIEWMTFHVGYNLVSWFLPAIIIAWIVKPGESLVAKP